MSEKDTQQRSARVQDMFSTIAPSYDFMNTLMTLGHDKVWREMVLDLAEPDPKGRLLDLGTGTGGIARMAAKRWPEMEVVGADFSKRMLERARKLPYGDRVTWTAVDALELPFPDKHFDVVTSGYLLRNLTDLKKGLDEQARVLRRGGKLVFLETTPPTQGALRSLVRFYLVKVLPMIGALVARQPRAYKYLSDTTMEFLTPQELEAELTKSGLMTIQVQRIMFGTQVVMKAVRH